MDRSIARELYHEYKNIYPYVFYSGTILLIYV